MGQAAPKSPRSSPFHGADARIYPTPVETEDGVEADDVWGFADTRFDINAAGDVVLTGDRYPLSGQSMPSLLPWVRQVFDIPLDPADVHLPQPPAVPPPRRDEALEASLTVFLRPDQVSVAPLCRRRHGHGQTQDEMYGIKYGSLPRLPDAVIYPESEAQVVQLVATAQRHSVCLIPFGGGTSVSEALRCPADETRLILSVDMRRMNRILWIDPVNRTACIEAGAVGRHLVAALAARGYTLGHEPDSIEFSTLGGWIATRASGMKKNKYGNIEDLVLDIHAITADGPIGRSTQPPRESIGTDLRHLLLGSEGRLGIITQAVVKVFKVAPCQAYGSVLFPDLERGVAFMYALAQTTFIPASVRLVDNLQFQLSLALKPKSSGLKAIKSRLEKFFVTRVRGMASDAMVACTLVFEGEKAEVARQEAGLYALARQHGGMRAGADNGRRGYLLTYSIAYIRDFVMKHYIIAESFETSVAWSRALELIGRVKARLVQEHSARQLPGKPFITARVTQVYDTGCCIYFYLAFCYRGVANPAHVFSELETAARAEILACSGSLSHHHGVGKIRQHFLPEVLSPTAMKWQREIKEAADPHNIFGCGN